MAIDPIFLFEQLAEYGTAPEEGCTLIGVGYEDAFDRLERKYLIDRFQRGGSAEKFVIGPFGSGKTHFLRQLMERARTLDCVTSEVALTKKVDFCDSLLVYQEIMRELRPPGSEHRGVKAFIGACVARVASKAPDASVSNDLVHSWAEGLPEANFELESFARVAKQAIEASLREDDEVFQAAVRWLEGEVTDRHTCKIVGETPISGNERGVHASRARLAVFQLARHAGFAGTVVAFDEAEQSFAVDKKRMAKIFSFLLADLNALASLPRGSALLLYAITPDVVEKIGEQLPALMQRLADPGINRGFFDGITTAPRIDLTKRDDPERELDGIAQRLVTVFFDSVPDAPQGEKSPFLDQLPAIVAEIARSEPSSSARREIVKRVASGLVEMRDRATGFTRPPKAVVAEAEV